MRFFSNFACAAVLIAAALPAFAQGTGTSVNDKQPWARATPAVREPALPI